MIWHHCPSHRMDPARHLSKKAPKRSKEEQERRRKAHDQAKADRGNASRRPPEVKEGREAIRRRRGKQGTKTTTRNFMLKPMRTIAPLVRCDPRRLERIRAKQLHYQNAQSQASSSGISPQMLARKRVSAGSSPSNELGPTPDERNERAVSNPDRPNERAVFTPRAKGDQVALKQLRRKDFNEQIRCDIELQAQKTAKRRRTSEVALTLPEGQCDELPPAGRDVVVMTCQAMSERSAIHRLLACRPRKQELKVLPES